MNSLFVAAGAVLILILGYIFYGRKLEREWKPDPSALTPAYAKSDGIDFIPARHWTILFSHHFASIAGAGPILGPVIAAGSWGWFPVLVWIIAGTLFIGGVLDFTSLFVSLRNGGRSISDISEQTMGKRVRLLLSLFLWFLLVLVVAVFAAVTANTLVEEPRIVLPTFGLIADAMLTGFLIYRLKISQVKATLMGLGLLALLLGAGYYIPIVLTKTNIWIAVLLLYAYAASILPVNLLLQPRDYLSTFILLFSLGFGYLGLFISRPAITTPALLSLSPAAGPVWPMLFVFVACGAISGFHSLVSSGTTSKQIASEKDAKKIGYGAMVLEAVLAVLALLTVSAGLAWTKNGNIPGAATYPELLKKGNWILTFATGYGRIVAPIFGTTIGMIIAMTTLNAFVMTTLDSATRINRYITEELFGNSFGIKILKNRYFSTLAVILPAGFLAFGNWKAIWPVFGASNQLVAALALIVISVYLSGRKMKTRYTLVPGIFMLLTAVAALLMQIKTFYIKKNYLLLLIAAALVLVSLFLIAEAGKALKKKRTEDAGSRAA